LRSRGTPVTARPVGEFIHLILSVHAANANPTPDRLSTLLRLAADSGLIDEGAVNDQLVYLVPGKLKARKVSIPLR